ncbi:uncharacterized protein BX663DRAFT_424704 [Cokeromyces recurvatus]|uniref:uncharacterized protein n=1 Tax=Cokeromyces recurvatus TaxID=90255 RepID=UPI00221FFB60|nr:uncharacterized protein BX663DRAFT_424704 [Cokeromyces recurvatus]KAI7908305.1 hypothetical protein BX663DRAFT_424704 [Cokeromyces recurvatus]
MSNTTVDNDKSSQITILRIKRKRTEEPLDALLSATALPTLFRLAETVEQKSFSNFDEAKKLKDRISRRIQPGSSRPQTPTLEDRKDRLVKEQRCSKFFRTSYKGFVSNV